MYCVVVGFRLFVRYLPLIAKGQNIFHWFSTVYLVLVTIIIIAIIVGYDESIFGSPIGTKSFLMISEPSARRSNYAPPDSLVYVNVFIEFNQCNVPTRLYLVHIGMFAMATLASVEQPYRVIVTCVSDRK